MTAAVPLHVITALGFGPLGYRAASGQASAQRRLDQISSSSNGFFTAVETCGITGQRLVVLLAELGGTANAEQLAHHTATADPGVIERAIDRLERAGIVVRGVKGGLRLSDDGLRLIQRRSVSYTDAQAITSDILAVICRQLGLRPTSRKQERIDAITGVFADAVERERIRGSLSQTALDLLDRIAATGQLGPLDPEVAGVHRYHLSSAAPSPYAHSRERVGGAAALAELADHGIVGIAPWEGHIWIWREARPITNAAIVTDWEVAPPPATTTIDPGVLRLPEMTHLVDRCLDVWAAASIAVLKNGEARLPKAAVRTTAKQLGVDQEPVDLAARLAISIGLLRPHTTGMTGRGRNRRPEQVWQADPVLIGAWQQHSATERWARLIAEWCRPRLDVGVQLLVNRHLLLWELTKLTPDTAWTGPVETFCRWFADEHTSLGHPDACTEVIDDLRHLGVVTGGDTIALTPAGRLVLDGAERLTDAEFGGATTAVVQPDFTVIAPPDLDPDLLARLRTIAELVTDGGALVFRLVESSITRAVQAGDHGDSIVEFLRELSSVPISDTVERLVHDAASRAHSLTIHPATSVIVVDDPADLATACSIASAKLTRLTDTVASSPLPPAKLLAALDRKGLIPHVAAVTSGSAAPRASDRSDRGPADRSDADPLVVRGALTATPDLVQQLLGPR